MRKRLTFIAIVGVVLLALVYELTQADTLPTTTAQPTTTVARTPVPQLRPYAPFNICSKAEQDWFRNKFPQAYGNAKGGMDCAHNNNPMATPTPKPMGL